MTTRTVGIICAGCLGLGALAAPAAAAPRLDPGVATAADIAAGGVENVRWVCGPYRCWWRPNYFYGPRPFYGPRRFYGPRWGGYGWRRGWRRW